MQVTVENVSELNRRMTVTVEDVNIEQATQERLKAIRPSIKMAGFRPGKVPLSMVARTHGSAARREIIDAVVQQNIREAFTQENVNPASPPNIVEMKEDGGNFIFSMEYEVFPELDSVKLDGITVEKVTAEVTDEDVDKMLETLREQRMSWEPLKRAAKEEDGVTIDFVGSIDGVEFPGGSGQDVLVEIGNGSMLPEFEQQLVGVKAGQETTIELTFPEDYRAEHLRGKQASFAITVKSVAKKKLPKLDKEFAEMCGVDGGIAALKKEVRANMERELRTALKASNKRKVMDAILSNNELTLPEGPIQREAEFLMEQGKNNLRQQGVNVEGIPFEVEAFKDNARRRVALSVLIGKLVSDNKITPDEASVKAEIDIIAANYEDPEDVHNYYNNNQERLAEIQMMVVEDKVVEWIYDHVKVTESTSNFSEVMNSAAA
ncbi:trigger factor [Methylophaga lonarensis MPL]|uniref:Trigger factor n=1 Tax=Methylophaga lonarensis MPL TaxID=1286106 RepID=M7NZP6_9GAMM|nr:trigger factor [Methylophaga lonarensis]EMR12701.1 trigger factor [Methylophaga lonarensis MPL]